MRRVALLLSLVTITAAANAAAQKQPVSGGRIAGEIAAGFVGVPVGFAVGYTIGSGFQPHGSSNTGVVAGFAGALVGPAAGVTMVGRGGPSRGSFGAAVVGSAAGYAATYAGFRLLGIIPSTKLQILTGIVAVALPAVGATIAYNHSRP